jgi:hypothetical protein
MRRPAVSTRVSSRQTRAQLHHRIHDQLHGSVFVQFAGVDHEVVQRRIVPANAEKTPQIFGGRAITLRDQGLRLFDTFGLSCNTA